MLFIQRIIKYGDRSRPAKLTRQQRVAARRATALASGRCGECVTRFCDPGRKICETCCRKKDKYR